MAIKFAPCLSLLLICDLSALVMAGFDLNALPEDDQMSNDEVSPAEGGGDTMGPAKTSPAIDKARTSTDGTGSNGSGKMSKEQAKKLNAMYGKILKLFKVLEICERDDFDIDKITIPDSWVEQSKAMMVLTKVSKQGLVKKRDMQRLKLILKNCNEISRRVNEIAESKMSMESQMSGMDLEDASKFNEQIAVSPLGEIRDQLLGSGRVSFKKPEAQVVKTAQAPAILRLNTHPRNIIAPNFIVARNDNGNNQPTTMFNFI